eukprot:GHVU01052607.1.p1 GENE.GHVU01052607.1~~GHVU01052607.1.p1  ORF type:complete len:344 (-),score=15.96 GHVU01052607.1:1496-2377(-)
MIKDLIRLALRWLRASRRVGGTSDDAYKVSTFRGELALVVCAAFAILNAQQKNLHHKHCRGIARAFQQCGFDTSQEGTAAGRDIPAFEEHIKNLKRSPCYANLAQKSNRQPTDADVVKQTDRRLEVPVSQVVVDDGRYAQPAYGFAPFRAQGSPAVAVAEPSPSPAGRSAGVSANSSGGLRGDWRPAVNAATGNRTRIVGSATGRPRAQPCIPPTLNLRCDDGGDSSVVTADAPQITERIAAALPPDDEASALRREQTACVEQLRLEGIEQDALILALADIDAAVEGLLPVTV